MKLLCLDVGTKRIGVAKSDPLGITAEAFATIKRSSLQHDFSSIERYITELNIEKLIIGLPLDEESQVGKSAQKILNFIDKLKVFLKDEGIKVDIETWDERYSTAEAEEHLISLDVSRKKRKEVIDKMAALVILRNYMQAKG